MKNEFDNFFPIGRITFSPSDTNTFQGIYDGVPREKEKSEIEKLNDEIQSLRDEIRILRSQLAGLEKRNTYYINIPVTNPGIITCDGDGNGT